MNKYIFYDLGGEYITTLKGNDFSLLGEEELFQIAIRDGEKLKLVGIVNKQIVGRVEVEEVKYGFKSNIKKMWIRR